MRLFCFVRFFFCFFAVRKHIYSAYIPYVLLEVPVWRAFFFLSMYVCTGIVSFFRKRLSVWNIRRQTFSNNSHIDLRGVRIYKAWWVAWDRKKGCYVGVEGWRERAWYYCSYRCQPYAWAQWNGLRLVYCTYGRYTFVRNFLSLRKEGRGGLRGLFMFWFWLANPMIWEPPTIYVLTFSCVLWGCWRR